MVLVLGDVHGKLEPFKATIMKYGITDCSVIQVGDFGVGFESFGKERERLKEFNKFLAKRNISMYVVRGNHDDPAYFTGLKVLSYSHLTLVPDYTVLELDGKRILCIGGALSIDRVNLINYDENKRLSSYEPTNICSYWKDEVVPLNKEVIAGLQNIDVLISHTAPSFCYPPMYPLAPIVQEYVPNDPTLIADLQKERNLMDEIFELLTANNNNITHHFYGHFHSGHNEFINGCYHRLLAIDEIYTAF